MDYSMKNHKFRLANIIEMNKKYVIIAILFSVTLISAQTKSGTYTIKSINVNTEFSDFGTAYFGNDSIVFSSPTKKKIIRNIWKPNDQPYLDLYIGTIGEAGEIIGKHKIKGIVNTKFHEAIVVFTKDMKTVYYTGNNNYDNHVKNDTTGILRLQLYKAKVLANGKWTNVEKLPFNDDEFSTGHPALSEDGKKLYFVSDRPGSIGETDIYVVNINNNGSYSTPKNLGSNINTTEKEMFPHIKDDIIYYSSEGHNTIGGLDVFANKMYDNTISRALNIGEPINSVSDDFSFIIADGKGYFSSDREEGVGGDDIYSFSVNKPIKFECTQKVSGVVINNNSKEILTGVEIKLVGDNNEILETVLTDNKGVYSFTVKCNSTYKILGNKESFLEDNHALITINDILKAPISIPLALKPEIIESKINIENIYFDLDKWSIRADAAIELDKLVQIMKDNPELIIEASSHTDSRQTDVYNNRLSSNRAKSSRKYIISKGINAKRISAKGYGETQLTNKCSNDIECTDDQHQTNRRTEFIVVNKSSEDSKK